MTDKQVASASLLGYRVASGGDNHAEIKLSIAAAGDLVRNGGNSPIKLYADNKICGEQSWNCSAAISAMGGVVDPGGYYAIWPLPAGG